MAESKATLLLEIKDFFSSKIGNISAQLAVLRQGFLAISGVVNSVIGVFQSLLNEYGAQELAVNKLENALKNQGITSKAATDDLVDFANELQNTTTIADDAALEAMALGTTFGLVGEDLKRTTKAAADMSAAMGIDLKTTMLLLGKAAVGETATLSRYGITIADNIPKAQQFEEVLKQLNSRFGGSAAAQTQTYSGKVAQLANQFSDLKEGLGSLLVGPATAFINWAVEATQKLNALFNTSKLAGIEVSIQKLEQEKEAVNATLASYSRYGDEKSKQFLKSEADLKSINARIDGLKREEEQLKKTAWAGANKFSYNDPEAEAKRSKIAADAQLEIDTAISTDQQLADIKANARAKELADAGQLDLAIQTLDIRQQQRKIAEADLEKRLNAEKVNNFKSTMGFIASSALSSNKTLVHLTRAAGIANAIIDTNVAATKALASAPPPFGAILAGIVRAAGMANVASIAGVKLAEGGMLMPRSGGVSAVMADAGKAEVAIPLDDERTKDKLRDTLGDGGGTTVIIQAGTIVADEYSLDQFAQKIDEKLYGLQRNRRSNL